MLNIEFVIPAKYILAFNAVFAIMRELALFIRIMT